MKATCYFFIFCVFVVNNVSAKIHADFNEQGIIAQVDGWKVPEKSFEIYHKYLAEQDESLSKQSLLSNLLFNRLISQYAKKEIGETLLNDDSPVAYTSETAVNDLFSSIVSSYYKKRITKSIEASEKASIESFIISGLTLKADELKRIVTAPNQKFVLVYRLNDTQQEAARSTALINYKFPNEDPRVVSLWDIYSTSNIQEKMSIHHLDMTKLSGLIQRYMSSKYTQYWLVHHSGLSHQEIAAIYDFIKDNRTAGQFYRYTGFKAGIHDDNPGLKKAAQNVTLSQIKHYYESNKDDFGATIKVRARHITLDSQSKADMAHNALKNGMSFSDAIKNFSISDDKNSSVPGDLGWIPREGKKQWLKSIPFTLEQGAFSSAFKSPIKKDEEPVWEIVFVDEKVEGFFAVGSETVRYAAATEIAKKTIQQQILSLRKQLLKHADIDLRQADQHILDTSLGQLHDVDMFEQEHTHEHN